MKKPTVLMVLDGFGISDEVNGNAVKLANTPVIDKLFKDYPWEKGLASGLDVGLPDGQMGNSEVGHLNIGAGRIVYQELTRISKSISNGDFFKKNELIDALNGSRYHSLHLMGLLSDGGVHSHIDHLKALLDMAKNYDVEKVYVHVFLDGRDTPPNSAKDYVKELQDYIRSIDSSAKIATVMGRYYAMDRDNRWDRVQLAYDAMVKGEGEFINDPIKYLDKSYDKNINDEFVIPAVVADNELPIATVEQDDTVIFFNFRGDRAREISRAFCNSEFNSFDTKELNNIKFYCFTDYDKMIINKTVIFKSDIMENTLGEYLSKLGKKQLRLAETEKYAHVTFFFNGGIEVSNPGEDRILIPSPKVSTYDLKPEMSAIEVTDKLVENILEKEYDVIIVNYANPDMVGHTGIISAAIKALETVDKCLDRVIKALLKVDGQALICADHGNADKMLDYDTGKPFTAHTSNPVPFILVNCDLSSGLKQGGRLSDLAPTLLDMMCIEIPKEMTGKSLLVK